MAGDPGDPRDPRDLTEITCPRCGVPASARFYGPCDPCRQQLRAGMTLAPRRPSDGGAPRFEPKMHVVPNQVATKE